MTRLIAIIVGLAVMMPLSGSSCSIPLVSFGPVLTALDYNIRGNPIELGEHGYWWRARKISRAIAQEDASLVTAQECWFPFVVPATWRYGIVGSRILNSGGTPIFYDKTKAVETESGFIELPGEHFPFGELYFFGHQIAPSVPRRVTWARFESDDVDEDPVYVFNLHLSSQDRTARLKSLEVLVKEVPRIAGDNHVIMMGDLNIRAGDRSVANFKRELSLVDAYRVANPGDFGATYQGFGKSEPLRIDYGLFCECFVILSADVLEYEDYPSDHNPLRIKAKQ